MAAVGVPVCTGWVDGHRSWVLDGLPHRVDGPAVEWVNGSECWFLHGVRHRVGGPAVTLVPGDTEWWVNGELHRTDGPAHVFVEGDGEWFLHGVSADAGALERYNVLSPVGQELAAGLADGWTGTGFELVRAAELLAGAA